MFLNAREYARSQGLPIKFVRRMCRTNKFPHLTIGSVYYINPQEVNRIVEGMAATADISYVDKVKALMAKEKNAQSVERESVQGDDDIWDPKLIIRKKE